MKKIYFLGIDVAKDCCDFALLKSNGSLLWRGQFNNNPASIRQWVNALKARQLDLKKILFGFEATGISVLRRTKNDPADASLIARFLLERHPVPSRPLTAVQAQLKELVSTREALSIDLARERNRGEKYRTLLHELHPVLSAQRIERLGQLKAWIKELDQVIAQLIDSEPSLRAQAQLLCSIPGIALCTAAKILSQLAGKEFQSAHQLALYAGLNPMQNQSGRSGGKSALSKIGNAFLRKAFFMPAAVAARHCAPIKLWIQQLQARRPDLSKLALRGAVMHKLIRIVFGVLKNQTPFDSNLAASSISI